MAKGAHSTHRTALQKVDAVLPFSSISEQIRQSFGEQASCSALSNLSTVKLQAKYTKKAR